MAKETKRQKANSTKVDRQKRYDLAEAVTALKDCQALKFDETVDVAIRLGVDPKKSDQMVRGVVRLPFGTGRTVRVLVFAKGDKEREAREAGADFVGAEDLVEKIKAGWLDFDKVIATPDMMAKVGPIAKILGPRGLMPNPKTGTVTTDVVKAIEEERAGRVEFRVDKQGNVHAAVGKKSFQPEHLVANIKTLVEQVVKQKPATAKGIYFLAMSLSSTMGPGYRLDTGKLEQSGVKG